MEMKIPALVYCEIEYIEDFLLKYKEKQKMQDDAPEEYHPFLVFYRFLISSNIVMNISNDEYADKTKDNTLLLKLWKRFSVNGTNNHFEWDGNPKRQTNQEIYFVLNDTKIKNETDCLTISSTDFNKDDNKKYLEETVHTIKKHEYVTWPVLLQNAKCNCNSIVIYDNYILNNRWRENILPIIESILPPVIKQDFYISIFALDEDNCSRTRFKSFTEELARRRNDFNNIKFMYHKVTKMDKDHGRVILTNYLFITSDAGFDLIGSDGKSNDARIVISYPLFNNDSNQIGYYNDRLHDILHIMKISSITDDNPLLK